MIRKRRAVVRAFEYGRVALPQGFDNARTRERLEAAAGKVGISAFETRNHRLYAQGVVGVVDIGDVVVEILPKTRDRTSEAEGVAFLTDILAFVGSSDKLAAVEASIASNEKGFLEAILAWAIRLAATNIREGTPKRYVVREEISTAVRGRIELRRIARQRPGRAFELVIRHAPLSVDNAITRIVKWLAVEIGRRTRLLRTRAICQQVVQELDGVLDITPIEADFATLELSRFEERWRPLIDLARTLVAQGRPDPTQAGGLPAVALLFTLHDLFEATLRRVFSEGLRSHSLTLQPNSGQLLRAHAQPRSQFIRLKPDFRISGSRLGAPTAIGDAKWKRIFQPSGEARLSEADAYQVATYLTSLQAEVAFVFCPLPEGGPLNLRTLSYEITGIGKPLHVVGVDLPKLIARGTVGIALREQLCAAVVSALGEPKEIAA